MEEQSEDLLSVIDGILAKDPVPEDFSKSKLSSGRLSLVIDEEEEEEEEENINTDLRGAEKEKEEKEKTEEEKKREEEEKKREEEEKKKAEEEKKKAEEEKKKAEEEMKLFTIQEEHKRQGYLSHGWRVVHQRF